MCRGIPFLVIGSFSYLQLIQTMYFTTSIGIKISSFTYGNINCRPYGNQKP